MSYNSFLNSDSYGFNSVGNLNDWRDAIDYNRINEINSQSNNGGFGFNNIGSLLSAGTGIMQGITGLGGLSMAKKNYKLAKKQFGFQKGLANRNLLNQAKIINNSYDNAAQVAAGMIGSRNADGSFGMTSQDIVNKYTNRAKEKHVDGSPV